MHLHLLYWAEEREFEVSVLVELKSELYCLLNHMQHRITCIPWVMCVAALPKTCLLWKSIWRSAKTTWCGKVTLSHLRIQWNHGTQAECANRQFSKVQTRPIIKYKNYFAIHSWNREAFSVLSFFLYEAIRSDIHTTVLWATSAPLSRAPLQQNPADSS